MNITTDDIERELSRFWRRSDAARAAGAISVKEQYDGTKIPDGWVLDHELDFWLPPNVRLL